MTFHQLISAIPLTLATEILEYTFANDKTLYQATLDAVAQARKVRPVFLQRQPRTDRHLTMLITLSHPPLELAADSLIRNWLLKTQVPLLTEFLDGIKIPHEKGVVEEVPPSMDDAVLQAAVEAVLAKHPHEVVAIYLHAFHLMNERRWQNLGAILEKDARLQLKP